MRSSAGEPIHSDAGQATGRAPPWRLTGDRFITDSSDGMTHEIARQGPMSRRRPAAWVALVSLLLQLFIVPAGFSLPPERVAVCTAGGVAMVALDGEPSPASLPPGHHGGPCVLCQTGTHGLAPAFEPAALLLPTCPGQSAALAPFEGTVLPPPRLAGSASPQAPPSSLLTL